MGLHHLITALIFALVLARVELSTCHVLKGSVTCLDCNPHYDLSDIKVLVKCSQVKKLAMATTTANGTFETELPSDAQPPPSFNCLASVFGGPSQLYVSRKNMVSRTTKLPQSDSYTISTPLKFHKSCPLANKDTAKCGPPKRCYWVVEDCRSASATGVGTSSDQLLFSLHAHHRHTLSCSIVLMF